MYFYTPGWELTLFTWINQDWQNPIFDVLMPVFSSAAFLWALGIVLAVAGLKNGKVTLTVVLGLALSIAASDLTCSVIKDSVGRLRPYHSLAGTRYLDSGSWKTLPADYAPTKRSGSSFPSAHASNAAAATFFLYAVFRRKSLCLIPLVIGFSRVYLGKHFPMDVMAGWSTGLALGGILVPVYPILFNRIRSLWMRYRFRA
jgi:undecaprenyl-diphosphatase